VRYSLAPVTAFHATLTVEDFRSMILRFDGAGVPAGTVVVGWVVVVVDGNVVVVVDGSVVVVGGTVVVVGAAVVVGVVVVVVDDVP